MSSTPSNAASRSTLSSGSEKTPDSGTPRTKRVYKKSIPSPSLQAFDSFVGTFAQFSSHVETKIDRVGKDDVNVMQTELEELYSKCERMKKRFQLLISHLDEAIKRYESKKPANFAAESNDPTSLEGKSANRASLLFFEEHDIVIDAIFAALNKRITKIAEIIGIKINRSRYNPYSSLLEDKLKNLKGMCEDHTTCLDETGKSIEEAIVKNEEIRRCNVV